MIAPIISARPTMPHATPIPALAPVERPEDTALLTAELEALLPVDEADEVVDVCAAASESGVQVSAQVDAQSTWEAGIEVSVLPMAWI